MYHFKAFGYSVGVVIHGPAVLLKKEHEWFSHSLSVHPSWVISISFWSMFLHRTSAWDLHFLSQDLLSLLEHNPQSSDLEDPENSNNSHYNHSCSYQIKVSSLIPDIQQFLSWNCVRVVLFVLQNQNSPQVSLLIFFVKYTECKSIKIPVVSFTPPAGKLSWGSLSKKEFIHFRILTFILSSIWA